jgi:hypothetical protein
MVATDYLNGPLSWTLSIRILELGAVLVGFAAPLALALSKIPGRVTNGIGLLAFAVGALACLDFLGVVTLVSVYPHRPGYEELTLVPALYLLVAEATDLPGRRLVYLLLSWMAISWAAWEQVTFWGGLGTHAFLDAALLGALVLPPCLAWTGRGVSSPEVR